MHKPATISQTTKIDLCSAYNACNSVILQNLTNKGAILQQSSTILYT